VAIVHLCKTGSKAAEIPRKMYDNMCVNLKFLILTNDLSAPTNGIDHFDFYSPKKLDELAVKALPVTNVSIHFVKLPFAVEERPSVATSAYRSLAGKFGTVLGWCTVHHHSFSDQQMDLTSQNKEKLITKNKKLEEILRDCTREVTNIHEAVVRGDQFDAVSSLASGFPSPHFDNFTMQALLLQEQGQQQQQQQQRPINFWQELRLLNERTQRFSAALGQQRLSEDPSISRVRLFFDGYRKLPRFSTPPLFSRSFFKYE
jgi:hypothetical protein